jgi:hypothetical protein
MVQENDKGGFLGVLFLHEPWEALPAKLVVIIPQVPLCREILGVVSSLGLFLFPVGLVIL